MPVKLSDLPADERDLYLMVWRDGVVCAEQLNDAEQRIATRLVRRGMLDSERHRDCGRPHYREGGTVIVDTVIFT